MSAARKSTKTADELNPFINPAREIIRSPLEVEVETSFLSYAYSVIYSRALPDARDGMKPVHRRILYTMLENGFTPDKNHVKSAKITGATIGTYHPHGDTACYDALVRLVQPFSMMVPLIDGHGNFGDQPGSQAAAARYTESRISKEAMLLMSELKENTVDTRPNYDNSTTEPVVLPVQFPNLIINGGSGIAVGMATNMPTHNPGEVMDAARWLLTHPNAPLEKLMEFVPGPDFPTGGIILGVDAIQEAYETGRGRIRIRGRYTIEDAGRGKNRIVFDQLPYGVSAERIIENVKDGISNGKLSGIADIKDLTDRRNGIRLVIETKAGINAEALVFDLFKHTMLEDTFGINNVALVNGEPRTLGLKEMLQIFLDHRLDIVTRRTQNRLDKRETRLHLVEGLLKAMTDIDKVIAIIRQAPDVDTAKTKLMKTFKMDDVQAEYTLSLQLRRLTKFDQLELSNEKKALEEQIKELRNILDNPDVMRKLIGDELSTTKKEIDVPRRSVIKDGDLATHMEESKLMVASTSVEVEDKPCTITLLASGNIVRTDDTYTVTLRGKVDPIVGSITATTRGTFVAVTNKGTGHRVEALHVSEGAKSSPKDMGLSLGAGERIVAIGRNVAEEGEAGLALGTKQGTVKIVNSKDYPLRADEFPAMTLEKGDEIIGGGWVANAATTDFAFISSDTSLLRFEASKVRPAGSKAGGVAGLKLAEGATAITFAVIEGAQQESAEFVTYTGSTIKRSMFSLIPKKGRATGGVRSHALRKGEEKLAFAAIGTQLLVVDKAGKSITLPPATKRDASGTPAEGEPAIAGVKG